MDIRLWLQKKTFGVSLQSVAKQIAQRSTSLHGPFVIGIATAALLTTLFLYPIISHFSTHLPSHQDGVFISWTIDWVSTAFITGQDPYHAPLFYPYSNTLTFSDPFFSTAVFNIPFAILSQFSKTGSFPNPFLNLVIIHNIHLVTGSIATFLAMFLLCRYLFSSTITALICATVFNFSVMHFAYIIHLHTFLIAGIPLAVLFLLQWFDQKKFSDYVAFHLAFVYQSLNAPMTGFFLVSIVIPFVITRISHPSKSLFSQEHWLRTVLNSIRTITSYKKEVFTSVITCLLVLLIYLPYFETTTIFSYTRSIRDTAHFSHSLDYFFNQELVFLYSLIAILWLFKKIKPMTQDNESNKKQGKNFLKNQLLPILLVLLIGGILALGPVLKINGHTTKLFSFPVPLPYAVLYYVIPGFKAFRTSSRWIVVFNFGLSLLLGYIFTQKKTSHTLKISIFIIVVLNLYIHSKDQIPLFEIPQQIPSIYSSLKIQPEDATLELPAYVWSHHPYVVEESNRLIYQKFHHKKLYNGHSGFTPPEREHFLPWLTVSFPNKQSIHYLMNNNLDLVIIHFDQYHQLFNDQFSYQEILVPSVKSLKENVKNSPNLEEISCQNNSCLYRIKKNTTM